MKLTGANHYEILNLQPKAAPEQIERAYEFFKDMYGEEGLATYSLLEADELEAVRARMREAYAVLSNPTERHRYDVEQGFSAADEPLLPFEPPPPPEPAPPEAKSPSPPAPAPPPAPRPTQQVLTGPVRGDDLRRLREEKGISLQDIAASSKIGVRYLEYIESDRHSHLPARVYLRGFLMEYAKALGLDPDRTVKAYLAQLDRRELD
jgi:curved DNA-binding protein CbpA